MLKFRDARHPRRHCSSTGENRCEGGCAEDERIAPCHFWNVDHGAPALAAFSGRRLFKQASVMKRKARSENILSAVLQQAELIRALKRFRIVTSCRHSVGGSTVSVE